MIDSVSSDLLKELHFALNVMEENTHLGLNNRYADKLKTILLSRITETEAKLGNRPATVVSFSVCETKLPA